MADPFRYADRDIEDALDHAYDFGASTDPSDYKITREEHVPIEDVLYHDDYSSWGEWEPGELAALDAEAMQELESYRGVGWAHKALGWLEEGIPAIVVVEGVGISDGRGRVNFAVGMGIDSVPVIWMKPKNARRVRPLKSKRKRNLRMATNVGALVRKALQ